MVLAVPKGSGPQIIISSTNPPKTRRNSHGSVMSGWPEGLALVPVIGRPNSRASVSGTGWSGIRTAMVSRFAVKRTGNPGIAGNTSVSDPGQNRAASVRANVATDPCTSATWLTCSHPDTSTGSGKSAGRPFTV